MKKIILKFKIALCKKFPMLSPKLRRRCKIYKSWLESHEKIRDASVKDYLKRVAPELRAPNYLPILIPYDWTKSYYDKIISIYFDNSCGLPYVIHEGKKLFFPKSYSKEKVEISYKQLLIEQDKRSPHRYFSDFVSTENIFAFIDVGCAEAIMALQIVEYVENIILLECSNEWVEALQMTFRQWKDKVKIINKFVGEKNTESFVTLDAVINSLENVNNKRIVVKMDLEGNERAALKGASSILKQKNIDWLCAIYHLQDDEIELTKIFENNGYNTEFSNNYILRYNSNKEKFFLTKGIVRCKKS